jgi:hypothetical protein
MKTNPKLKPKYLAWPWTEWRATVERAVLRGWLPNPNANPAPRAGRQKYQSLENSIRYRRRSLPVPPPKSDSGEIEDPLLV